MFREDNNSCKIDDDEEEDNGNCFVVISDFDACQKSDLTVRKDDIVTVINHDFRNNERNSGSVIANRRNSQNKILVRKCDQTRNQGLVPENILLPLFEEISQNDAFSRRKAVIDELIETEIEFITDLKFVVENYLRPASIKLVPKIIKENFQMLFGNLKEILEFHNTVVLEAVRYYATDPNLMGRAFIRLEREFDKHVRYCRDEPQAQQFLRSIAEVGAFFENLRRKLSIEDKGLSVHLKLPIQRINDYQLLFRELIRYSEILNENTNDLQRAYELMLNVPNRAEDDKFLDSIEGFRGNLHKFGRLIAHDWFSIKSGNDRLTDQPVKERYLFLFKGVILITKVKRISDNRSIFQFKESFKLQDLQFRDRTDNFEFEIIKNDNDDDDEDNRKSLLLISHRDETKTVWLNEIKKFATEFVDNNRSKVVSMSEPEEDKQTMSQNYSYKTSTTRSYYANRASLGEIQESSSSARQNYSTYTSRSKTISATSGDQLLKEVSESEPNNKNKRLPATIEEETAGDVVNIGKERRQRVLLKRLLKPCNVIPGENAIFEISFAEKYTKVNWLKDNRKFDENLLMRTSETHLDDSNTYQLEIRDCLSADSGIYTAIATTADGQEKSLSTTQLIVNDKNTIEIDDKSPIFTIKLKNIALLERTHLCFLVKVKGDPVPTVNFYKNNQLIDGSDDNMHIIRESASKGTYELFIDTVKYSDAGTYKCVAENVYGKDECECELTVTDHKDIFGELADAELLGDGEAATFTWKRDGKEFEPDERFKVLLGDDDDSLALIFQHVKPDDAGLYTCVAQTSNGRISCSAELTVQGAVHELHREPEKPMLEHVAVENVVTSGSVAVLEMKIKGYPKPEVTWTHDGEVIEPSGKYKFLYEDQESMSLMIKNVENRDSGMYQVSATNELGSDSKEIRLSVKSGPKIVTDLQDLKLLRDQKFELVIEVEGVPKPNVKIYKDGQELSSGECLQIDSENNRYRIKIKKVSNENAGSYSIVATNEISQASKFWKMSVESKPEVREAFDKYYEYELGKDVQIQCKIDANPKAEVKWFKHGKEIQDERYIIKEDDNCYMLRITGSVETDSDTYKVLAKNIHGSTEIGTSLVLKREPKITKGLKDLVANESDRNVELDVEVEAYPKPQIKWYLDEVEISESRTEFTRIESDNGAKLVIKEVTSGLAGKYCCRVINEMGETETSAKLTVQCKPRILKHLNNTTVEEGATLNLGIEVCANPEPAVKWLRNGKEITTDTRIRIVRNTERYETYDLIVDLVKYEDGGNYEVVVQNSLGTVSSKSTVIVQKMQMCDTLEETDEKHETDTDRETEQKGHVKSSDDVLDAIEDMNDIEEEFQERNEEFVEVDQISYEPEQTERCTQNDTGDENTIIDTGTEAEPIITGSNINDGKIVESADIEYKVQVCGSPVPIVTWMANKEVLQNDSRVAISQNGDEHKLLIKKARMDDAGIYQCRIKNNKGEIVQKAKLTVIPEVDVKRPIVIEHLKDASLKKSQDICLKLVLTSDSTPEFKWSLDGRPIQFSRNAIQMEFKDIPDEHIKEFTYLFHVYNCDISDSGMYKVLISNKFGECESDCKIEIVAAPVINGEKSVTGSLGNDTELAVEVKSVPPATIKWTKNGKVIDTDCGKYAVVSEPPLQKLIIKNVDLEDIGSYAVLAVNPEGESEHRISVTSDCEKPCFVKELSANCTIDDGDSVKLRVRCNGVPLPALRWFLNEQPLTDNGATCQIKTSESNESVVSEIELENSDLLNTAQIKCVAENVAGTATTVCQIAINQSPPIILRRLDRNVSLGEDQPLELVAKVTGSPKPEVKWFKDGKPIDECSGDFKTIELPDGVVKLTLEKATVKDAGTFKLLVKNMSGEATGVASVSVEAALQKPEFLKSLEDIEAVEGEQLKLEAIVKANPMPEIKWMKDGSPVKNAPNVRTAVLADGLVRFEIETLKADQAGIYSLVVSNSLGESAQSAKISVQQKAKKPGFLSDLSPFSKVVESFPAKFSVQTTGFPPPKVQWYLNNEPIEPVPGKIEITNEPDGTSSLVVQQCTLNDAGVYEAVAENECGKSSQKCELKVTPKCNQNEAEEVPMFLSELKDIEIDEGETLKLEAVIAGNPIPEIKWSRNGKCLENALKSCDGRKAHLVLDKVTLADSGSFCCALQNGKGSAKSECNVIVRKTSMAPSFIEKLNDVQQVPGHNAILQVKIAGKPQPTVAWFKENQPIADTSKYYIKSDGNLCQLHVRDCDGLDSGQYKCQIANSEGQSSCCASLNVVDKIKSALKTEPANFLKRITDLDLYPEMTAKFTACASGIPDPTIEWFHNGKPLFNAGRYRIECDKGGLLRLTIADVSDSDLGEYTCKASNASGSDTCTAKLTFDSFVKRPKKPSLVETMKQTRSTLPGTIPQALTDAPYITRMSDRNVTLSWRPLMPMTYREPITYRLEMCEMPGDDSWRTVWTNIRSCTCGVRDLKPNADYKFRVRTENKYGMSEPSPYVMTYRQKFTAEPKSRKPYLGPDEKFDPKTSFYFPKDFDLERPSLNALNQAPVFLRQERDRQFGVKDQNSSLFWYVYGYPRPVMSYYFNGEPIESGGRFDFSYTRNGQATLFINKMLDRDAGIYEAVAKNDFGEARQTLRFDFAEIPYFMRRPDIQCSRSHGMARFEARIAGIPKPEIRWYKDWKLLSSSTRLTFDEIENDTYVLTIRDLIQKDEGLYSISATNIAGTVSHSVMLYVEDNDHDYEFRTYTNIRPLSIKKQLFSDFYELGEELGRGTQGITYHAVNRSTGINYAAKIMHGRDELRRFMYNEYDAMNNLHHRKLVRLHDVYENDDSFILVMELAGGGQLVRDYLIKRDYYYESEISSFVRQSLLALDYMHSSGYAHLGLNIGDILLSHIGGHDLKLADFGLARKIFVDNLADLKYGMPDYVSPEIANGSSVSYKSDSWTIGIITYILLSGRSPFLGENDRETLTRIRHGEWTFDDFYWSNISSQAKDFISKLLVYKSDDRLSIREALDHPWVSGMNWKSDYQISSEYLRKYYYDYYANWYDNASCRTWYRRRRLSLAYEHPSHMVYPPYEVYTPSDFDCYRHNNWRNRSSKNKTNPDSDSNFEPMDLSYDIGVIKSESHYQNGPDTYLLQLRDVDFPVRLREYMKVAASRSHSPNRSYATSADFDRSLPSIRERRRFTDIMDEEIEDERKKRIKQYGSDEVYSLRRLRHELGTRLDTYVEAEAMLGSRLSGQAPFFREKPTITVIVEGEQTQISCLAIGDPKPVIQWFKNDAIIVSEEHQRISVQEDSDGRSLLCFRPASIYDIGLYKAVARNKLGQTVARARVVMGSVPDPPQAPKIAQISDTEILLTWNQPKDFGHSPVICFKLQYKQAFRNDWKDLKSNIDHEFYCVRNLEPEKSYVFRLATRNKIGWSSFSLPTNAVETKRPDDGHDKIKMSNTMISLQQMTDSDQTIHFDSAIKLDYSLETNLMSWICDANQATENYTFLSEIYRGQFSTVLKGVHQTSNEFVVAKILEMRPEVENEFEVLRTLRHQKIASLIEAYKSSTIAVFILEKLQGADVLSYLATRLEYSEQVVANIVLQILNALQYMHWRGFCHLNIQPDNIVMCSVRTAQIKLVDMGSAKAVSRLGTAYPKIECHRDFISPEMLSNESLFPQTDIWSLGVLTYLMLSGTVPFDSGEDDHERSQNIIYVRYRFENLYKDISQESIRFLMSIFKRSPGKRPTCEECLENRWFQPTDFMIRKREKAVFSGENLRKYSENYHNEKSICSNESVCKIIAKTLSKSQSIQDELITFSK